MRKYLKLVVATFGILLSIQLTGCGHISENVPDDGNFRTFLTRDLNTYFASTSKKPISVEYDLLRNSPTQTGVAYPKYYAWVRISEGKTIIEQGAVRLAACDKTAFEVTDFVSKKQIQKDPDMIRSIFPALLCPAIVTRANAAD